MIKSLMFMVIVVLLSGCASHVVFVKGEGVQANNCVYKNNEELNAFCDDFTMTLKTVYSTVNKKQAGGPFQFKSVDWELALEVTVKSTNLLPLLINGQTMTINQPTRLLSPIFLTSESSTQTTKAHSIGDQEVKQTFLIKLNEERPFTLYGLKVSVGDKPYYFDDIRILPTGRCYVMSCGSY